MEARARGYSERIQLGCLLHDGSEAYLSDVTRPIKSKLSEYLIVEDKLQEIIWNKFLNEPLSKSEKEMIFNIDDAMLSYEFKLLMTELISDKYKEVISRPALEFVVPSIVEKQFIDLFN